MTRDVAIVTRYVAFRWDLTGAPHDPRAWLTAAEQDELARLRDPLRRRQWLAGRWVGKQLVGEAFGAADMARVEILTRDERGRGSRPRIRVGTQSLDWKLSISHAERGVLAALSTNRELTVGVDLTGDVPCGSRFQQLWFTSEERRWVSNDPRRVAIIWSIKEAVYKACQTGQGWSPWLVEVRPRSNDQFACRFDDEAVDDLQLDISDIDGQVATVASVPARGDSMMPVAALPLEAVHNTDLSSASCL